MKSAHIYKRSTSILIMCLMLSKCIHMSIILKHIRLPSASSGFQFDVAAPTDHYVDAI